MQQYNGLEIAVIGISAQFPGSPDYRRFWHNLAEGRELLYTFSDEDLKERGVPANVIQDPRFVKTVGVVDNKDCFDAAFFGYTPEEALLMDPQIRHFHEHCWKALEDAGYTALIEKNKIGLFAGASVNDNWKLYAYGRSAETAIDPYLQRILMTQSFIATMVAYKLNLRGPAYYVDTACSTSLAAVHLACRSLLTRDCSIALAGGVCLGSAKAKGYLYQEGMISSRDGHCRTFDAGSSGTAVGEGTGVIVLKRLSEAIKDRDHIYAVIRATAANNDGNHKVGYTAPSVNGQADCITAAQKLAGIESRTIGYIEAHGTATRLGDPIEIKALNEAFGRTTDKFCAIGSVKTNIGHLDAAAGIAGLIKVALALKNKQIPASLHFDEPNPEIEFDAGPFYVNTTLKDWRRKNNTPLRAGISSFGIGGTNVHAVLEEAPVTEEEPGARLYKLLTISARTGDSVARYLDDLRTFLAGQPALNMADLSYTLQAGRKHFAYRKSIVYRDREELIQLLDAMKTNGQVEKCQEREYTIVFSFPGQGAQYENMTKDLYTGDPLFREEMDKGFDLLQQLTGKDLREVVFPETPGGLAIDETRYTQPLLFLVEYSLARLLMAMGITPGYMIGHSIGEYTAACISGVFSFEDALRLVVKRGELMDSLPSGAMLSIAAAAEEVQAFLDENISLAVINGPGQVVLSGDDASVDALKIRLDQAGIPFVTLHTSHAFHCRMQDPILEDFRKELNKVSFHKPVIPFLSNLTGDIIREEQACSPDYWVSQLRHTVRFSPAIQTILTRVKDPFFIEVGPGHSLTSLLKQHPQKMGNPPLSLNLIRGIREKEDDVRYFTGRIGQLWARGIQIDWHRYYDREKRRRIPLPTYSFDPVRYPAEVDPFQTGAVAAAMTTGAGRQLQDCVYYPFWKRTAPASRDTTTDKKGILFFSFDKHFSGALKTALMEKTHTWIEVYPDEGYEADHFHRLAKKIKDHNITDIIYAWPVGVDPLRLALDTSNREINLLYFGLQNIIQALLKEQLLQDKNLFVLTDALHRVNGTETGAYAQSFALGLVNVLSQEHGIQCCNIDLDLREPVEDLTRQLANEIDRRQREKRMVAFRLGHRWVRDYQKNNLPVGKEKTLLRNGEVYLITGGLGNVGFVLAKYLVKTYGAKVILIGRSAIEGNDAGRLTARLDHLKSLQGEARYYQVDVTDTDGLHRVVEEVEEALGPIKGIVHAAGIVDSEFFSLIEDMTPEKALTMFAPKVKGIEAIYEVFKHRRPDFVWMTSSLSTELGGLGYSAYSSANLYMEHFVAARSGELSNWKCIGLGEMIFSDGPGLTHTEALTPAEITTLFEWSLVNDTLTMLESKRELAERMHEAYTSHQQALPKTAETAAVAATAGRRERPSLATSYAEPRTDTEMKLKAAFENLLNIEDIGINDNFFELGGDSLKGMMLLKRIRNEFSINLSLADFFKRQTIQQLAYYIDEVESLASEEAAVSKIII